MKVAPVGNQPHRKRTYVENRRATVKNESDVDAMTMMRAAMAEVEAYYRERGIFQGRFGFGTSPALIVIDMAYGWTDPSYAGGSARLDSAIAAINRLLPLAR